MAGGDDYDEGRGNRPKEEEEPEERTDGWMTTYADLVTLLLTFFVLLFALSNVDEQKFLLFFTSITEGGMSIDRFEEIVGMFADPDADDPGDAPVISPPPDPDDDGNLVHQLEELFLAISMYIDDNDLSDRISLEYDGDFLLLTLSSDIVFASGSATITDEMEIIAGELARLIAAKHTNEGPFEIIITGHTDSVPPNVVWRSNWQLSANRAVNFLEVLLHHSDMDPRFFYSSGFGELHPVATNDTPEGRQMNRRVEVMISPLRLTSK